MRRNRSKRVRCQLLDGRDIDLGITHSQIAQLSTANASIGDASAGQRPRTDFVAVHGGFHFIHIAQGNRIIFLEETVVIVSHDPQLDINSGIVCDYAHAVVEMQRLHFGILLIALHIFKRYKIYVQRYFRQVATSIKFSLRKPCKLVSCFGFVCKFAFAVANLDVIADLLRIDNGVIVDMRTVHNPASGQGQPVSIFGLSNRLDSGHDCTAVGFHRSANQILAVPDLYATVPDFVGQDEYIEIIAYNSRFALRHNADIRVKKRLRRRHACVFSGTFSIGSHVEIERMLVHQAAYNTIEY